MKHELSYDCIREDCGGTCFGCTLGYCRNCGQSEGGLATECPGVPITSEQADDIYAGTLDFMNGEWITPAIAGAGEKTMSVKADTKYEAKVLDAFLTESKNSRTPAIFFLFETKDGPIDHMAYVTPKTLERLKETMADCFGVTAEDLARMASDQKWDRVIGKTISIETVAEEYNGNETVKVKWMNPARFKPAKVDAPIAKHVASMFTESTLEAAAPPLWNGGKGIMDDDVPF